MRVLSLYSDFKYLNQSFAIELEDGPSQAIWKIQIHLIRQI